MTKINGVCSINWCTCFREETPLHNYYVFITRVSIILVKRTLRTSSNSLNLSKALHQEYFEQPRMQNKDLVWQRCLPLL